MNDMRPREFLSRKHEGHGDGGADGESLDEEIERLRKESEDLARDLGDLGGLEGSHASMPIPVHGARRETEGPVDGSFLLEREGAEFHLLVHPARLGGRPVEIHSVVSAFDEAAYKIPPAVLGELDAWLDRAAFEDMPPWKVLLARLDGPKITGAATLEKRDGAFTVAREKSEARGLLTLTPPLGGGKTIPVADVENAVRALPLLHPLDAEVVREAVDRANRKTSVSFIEVDLGPMEEDGPAPSAPLPAAKTAVKPSGGVDLPAFFEVTVAPDAWTAQLTMRPAMGRGAPLDPKAVLAAIRNERIALTVPESEILKKVGALNEKQAAVEAWVIAKGTPVVHGENATFKASVPLRPLSEFGLAPTPAAASLLGKADRGATVRMGQAFGVIHVESPGQDGVNVRGEAVRARRGVNPYTIGENLRAVSNGGVVSLESTTEGLALIDGPRLHVVQRIDAKVLLDVTPDEMKADATLVPHAGIGRPLVVEDVYKALDAERITSGILKDAVDREFRRHQKDGIRIGFTVAEGLAPQHGQDARIDFHVRTETDRRPKIDEKGRIDWRTKENIIPVSEGAVLAVVTPATPAGADGQTVRGKALPAKDGVVKDLVARDGVATRPASSGVAGATEFYASLNGEFSFDPKTKELRVSRSKTVEAVNQELGHVKFDGNLTVTKDIEDGMEVQVTGDLLVQGTIHAARVSVDGTLTCVNGIVTRGQGWIKVKGDLRAKFIEHAHVECGGDIHIERAVLTSQVGTLGSLEILGKKSDLVGGRIQVGRSLKAAEIGSPSGTRTVIEAGFDYRRINEYRDLIAHLKAGKEKMARLDLRVEHLQHQLQHPASAAVTLKQEFREVLVAKKELMEEMKRLRDRAETLRGALHVEGTASVAAWQSLRAGVMLVMGDETRKIDADENAVEYFSGSDRAIQKRPAVAPVAEKSGARPAKETPGG